MTRDRRVHPHPARAADNFAPLSLGPDRRSSIASVVLSLTVAPSLGVELSPVAVHDAREIDRAVTTFARVSNGGLVVTAAPLTAIHRDTIIALTARHRFPAVYPYRFFVDGGGLVSYGPNMIDQYRRAASYVDRILKGPNKAMNVSWFERSAPPRRDSVPKSRSQ